MVKEINLDLPELLGKSETVTSPGASVQLPHNATSASVEVQGAYSDGQVIDSLAIKVDGTEHPIDLKGEVLAALPNGVRDTLDGQMLTKRVRKRVLDGGVDFSKKPEGGLRYFGFALPDRMNVVGLSTWEAPGWEKVDHANSQPEKSQSIGLHTDAEYAVWGYFWLKDESIDTAEKANQWLSRNPITLYYMVEPYTVHLDYSLPPVEGGEEMSVDTSLPTEVVWRYERMLWLPFEEIALVLDE